jgi:Tfp pilus assembly protein PilF
MSAPLLIVALAIAFAGCSSKTATDDQVAAMQAGLDALYTRHDPPAAETEFRKVLAANPTHYGATYQLAAALDAAGRPDEARPLWEKMLALAESAGDGKRHGARKAGRTPSRPETIMRWPGPYQRRDHRRGG